MECQNSDPAQFYLDAALMRVKSQYVLALIIVFAFLLCNFLEIHIFRDLLDGFRGTRVSLTHNPSTDLYRGVVSKCRILHGRYLPTPWLSSPHLQTAFLTFFGRAPVVSYRRQIFHAHDGEAIALDWLSDGGSSTSRDDSTPIVVIIPGLTSDSISPYVKHMAFRIAKHGWKVVVGNHRGLGGMSIMYERFYNAGWTEDFRRIVNHLHQEQPKAPVFAVGTSIGANILVKYLGEEGRSTSVAGAAAVCCPWDLVVCDRFINRKLIQRIYDRLLTTGLQSYAFIHEPVFTRLADWEGIKKARSVRDFDNYATCLVGKFECTICWQRVSATALHQCFG